MVAKVQACVDQVQGFIVFIKATQTDTRSLYLAQHYAKVADLLQETLDEYTVTHGVPPVDQDVKAAKWVLGELLR